MAQQMIALGNSPDGADGDDARTAFTKTNDNFTELYQGVGGAQPASPKLSAIAASVWTANQLLIATGTDTIGTLATGVTGRALVAANNAGEARSAIAAQASHANLTGLSSIPSALNRVPFFTSGLGEMGYFNSTAYSRDFFESADSATARGKLGLGTAAIAAVTTSPTDTTASRLLKTGDFGLGGNVPSLGAYDMNAAATDAVMTGMYYASAPLNAPAGFDYGFYNYRRLGGTRHQSLTRYATGRSWTRVLPDTGQPWSAWDMNLRSSDIVGTVSQASGVPTGAVMEKGQNAQGFYVRLADGTQLAWGEVGSNTLGAGTVTSTTVTFPIAFYTGAGAPVVSSNFQPQLSWDVYGPISNGVLSTTQVSITIRNGATAQTGTIRWSAVGRWF